jgi:hypothetical protein
MGKGEDSQTIDISGQTLKGEKEIFLSSFFSSDVQAVDESRLVTKIGNVMKEILEARFSIAEKRSLKPFHDRISFACPFCGDSARDTRKKRGNIFFNSFNYHCFNGDCDTHMPVYEFLDKFHKKDSFSPEEIGFIRERSTSVSDIHMKHMGKRQEILETMFSNIVSDFSIPRDAVMSKLRLREIRGSRIEKYMRERLQTKFEKFGFDQKKGQIYLFNTTADSERVIGMQIKTFNSRYPYITRKASYLHELMGTLAENTEEIHKLDSISNAFGILSVDINRHVTVFEGPFDSYLFPNSVGMCSVKNDFPFDLDGLRYFYDNDKTGKEWSMKKILENRSVFLWKKYLQESELYEFSDKIKDLNDLMIMVKRRVGKPKKFSDYFSTEKHDMIWI